MRPQRCDGTVQRESSCWHLCAALSFHDLSALGFGASEAIGQGHGLCFGGRQYHSRASSKLRGSRLGFGAVAQQVLRHRSV